MKNGQKRENDKLERRERKRSSERLAYQEISLKDIRLRRFRKNLRSIIKQAYLKKIKRLSEILNILLDKDKKSDEIYNKLRDLRSAYNRSIIECRSCHTMGGDRIYVPHNRNWYCLECYEHKLPKSFRRDWEPFYPFGKNGIIEFYQRLEIWFSERRSHTKEPLGDSRKILIEMGVSQKEQKRFLETLKEYGGFNDGEVLMNTWPYVRKDFGINKKIDFYIC